jgi:hypothetical protein
VGKRGQCKVCGKARALHSSARVAEQLAHALTRAEAIWRRHQDEPSGLGGSKAFGCLEMAVEFAVADLLGSSWDCLYAPERAAVREVANG